MGVIIKDICCDFSFLSSFSALLLHVEMFFVYPSTQKGELKAIKFCFPKSNLFSLFVSAQLQCV